MPGQEPVLSRYVVLQATYGPGVQVSYTEVDPPPPDEERGVLARDAGDAFRQLVIENPRHKWNGEYAVFPLAGSVRIGVQVELSVTETEGTPEVSTL